MANPYRQHYMAIADRANDPEGWTEDYPVELPLDLPDYDWPDAPDPRVNDGSGPILTAYVAACIAIIVALVLYLLSQVW